MKTISLLTAAIIMTTVTSQARTLSCTGIDKNGSKVSVQVSLNNGVSFDYKTEKTKAKSSEDYADVWTSDVGSYNLAEDSNEKSITGSLGSRGEKWAKLTLGDLGKANSTLEYDENDSGYEYSNSVSKMICR
ncbi:hypothetical protein B9G69_001770 [Bdellovibrio sp. SKB1291214]|uniref:hypothetical protein n=1 Tax=Bdellovibrio sp. SKB1291214 TaxID=1732569 RepID=UPI000B5161C9|nr:hypothetical protein [Bdellovibrio sp. SKB1291214]UYL09298.1 hypothetical protein B9G69_001770 [Bdellovibrio sp. SKB1291214]